MEAEIGFAANPETRQSVPPGLEFFASCIAERITRQGLGWGGLGSNRKKMKSSFLGLEPSLVHLGNGLPFVESGRGLRSAVHRCARGVVCLGFNQV